VEPATLGVDAVGLQAASSRENKSTKTVKFGLRIFTVTFFITYLLG
jgi:hypothetical protein